MDSIKGLFEIHIAVDSSEGCYPLWKYVSQDKSLKLILAVSETGVCRDQYMISKWKNGTAVEVIERANEIREDMEKSGVKVIRTKVESMANNDGVPATEYDYDWFVRNSQLVGKPYFEYHAKVDTNSNTIDDLAEWINSRSKSFGENVYVAVSVNICGSKIPMLTIRVYGHGRNYAVEKKNEILESLKNDKYKIMGGIQQEFSIYDTNDSVDKEWLI